MYELSEQLEGEIPKHFLSHLSATISIIPRPQTNVNCFFDFFEKILRGNFSKTILKIITITT